MRAKLKNIVERVAGWGYWIERSSNPSDVRNLISDLKAKETTAPLIRVGPDHDGGYLVPDDFDGITACISPGVSTEVGFDLDIAGRGIDVYMADASVDGPPQTNPRFHFHRKFLDVFEDGRHMRLDSLCNAALAAGDGDFILQMDIEGAEWRVLLDASPETLRRFRIMAIEFHDLRQMFSGFSFTLIRSVFQKLLRTHSVVHIHPNNVAPPTEFHGILVPTVMEMTFYRKDRGFTGVLSSNLPHSRDFDSIISKPPVTLPGIWK